MTASTSGDYHPRKLRLLRRQPAARPAQKFPSNGLPAHRIRHEGGGEVRQPFLLDPRNLQRFAHVAELFHQTLGGGASLALAPQEIHRPLFHALQEIGPRAKGVRGSREQCAAKRRDDRPLLFQQSPDGEGCRVRHFQFSHD